jgi:Fe-S cluster biogenesis protein NfuA
MVLDKIRSAFKKDSGKMERGELKIQASLASTNMVLFSLSETFLSEGKALCQSDKQAIGSPLLEKIFSINGVEEVFVSGDAMRVRFAEGSDLKEGAKNVGSYTREIWNSGEELIPKSYLWANAPQAEEEVFVSEAAQSEIGQQVNKVLKETVAPALASHGGHVTLVDIKDGYVHLNFGGGCQGCSQVTTTVKDGVEKVILQHFPEFKGVMDVTNHASGENPYYR